MRVIDLCSGLGGFSEAFLDSHDVTRIDNNSDFRTVIKTKIIDVMRLTDLSSYDVILASPPCQAFSVASIGHHWGGGKRAYEPKTEFAKHSIELVEKIVNLINETDAIFFIENPRGVMRKLDIMQDIKRFTVTYCQYGENRMKPTDVWTNSTEWKPRPMCKNGDQCHERAPRGAKTGTQGIKTSSLRAKIPFELSKEIMEACERELPRMAASPLGKTIKEGKE